MFERLSSEWLDCNASAQHFVSDGADVVVLGLYSGTYRRTGRYMEARFAHHWTLADGKVVSFQQYVDSLNSRPRKCLGFQTPKEVLMQEYLKTDVALQL